MLSSFGSAQIELRRVEYALSWPFLVDVTFLNEIESDLKNFRLFPELYVCSSVESLGKTKYTTCFKITMVLKQPEHF